MEVRECRATDAVRNRISGKVLKAIAAGFGGGVGFTVAFCKALGEGEMVNSTHVSVRYAVRTL